MNKSLQTLLTVLLLVGISLPMTTMAKGGRKGGGTAKPFTKIAEDTIESVTASSITITHNKDVAPKAGNGKGNNNGQNGKGQKAAPPEKRSMTYQITTITDIEVNGQSSNASALKPGMLVSISADPPSGLDPVDATNGGTATNINAHDAGQ
jgi:hypothetical protein